MYTTSKNKVKILCVLAVAGCAVLFATKPRPAVATAVALDDHEEAIGAVEADLPAIGHLHNTRHWLLGVLVPLLMGASLVLALPACKGTSQE